MIEFNTIKRVIDTPPSTQLEQLISFLKENGGNHVSHLFLLQDKELFWTENENALIVYKKIANKVIVLGDPIGKEADIKFAIKEFSEYANRRKLKPIFYQVSPKYMHYYHDVGFRFLKVGEEAQVQLDHFSLEGKQGAKLRNRLNKFERSQYSFRIVFPPYTEELLFELKNVSNAWLGNQKEKGFSVVSYTKEYVSNHPIALLYNPEKEIIAFATLATDYKDSISIDLMRKFPDSPPGTMDVLFIHIFKWSKDNGYDNCSLGMSPLSNVGNCKHSFVTERLIRLAFLYGNSIYNFKGLKNFKGKFATTWEPKYLAYKKSFLPITFLQILLIIHFKENPKKMRMNKGILKNQKDVLFDSLAKK